MMRLVAGALILATLMGAGPSSYSGRTTKSGNQTFYYSKSGQYQGRSTKSGSNDFYYGANNKPQGRTYSSGSNVFSYGNTPQSRYSTIKK